MCLRHEFKSVGKGDTIILNSQFSILNYSGKNIFPRGTLHSSGFMSTKIMSGPIRLIHRQGITKSSLGGHIPSARHRPGTTMATIQPSGISMRQSDTNPSRRPSLTQITSLHRRSENLQTINFPPCRKVYASHLKSRIEIFHSHLNSNLSSCYKGFPWGKLAKIFDF